MRLSESSASSRLGRRPARAAGDIVLFAGPGGRVAPEWVLRRLGTNRGAEPVQRRVMKTQVTLLRALRLAGAVGAISLAANLIPSASADPEISFHLRLGAPPAPRYERYEERSRPGPDYVWVPGYWAGEPSRYVWVQGHWERPSYRGARWVAPRWEQRSGGYVFIRGYWADEGRGSWASRGEENRDWRDRDSRDHDRRDRDHDRREGDRDREEYNERAH